jgi:superfamily II DNA/RNA helicase
VQVVDEADTIFAEGWGEELGQVLGPLRAKADPASVVLVSATMTKVRRK